MQVDFQVVFDNGMVVENGEIRLGPCRNPEELAGKLSLLVGSVADNIPERAQEDLAWLLMATTDWRPKYFARPAAVEHGDGRPLNELEERLTVLAVELMRLPGLHHGHVTEITMRWSAADGRRGRTFRNDGADAAGNWLMDEIRKGVEP